MASLSIPPNGPGQTRRFGRFEVEHVLGRGGMGTVFRARDPVIGRPLAIKQIRPDATTDPVRREELRARFELEFRSAGTLAHPNVVTIYDVGQAQDSYFIAMELIEGESLAQRLGRSPRLDPEEVVTLGRQIAAGLDYAHARSIVHRDVKPGNVLITPEGHVKITDFGLAKFLSTEVTQTGTLLGTPAFMAPEQVLGRAAGPKTDQFAFAVMLYVMLTGDAPFGSEHPSSILYKIVHEQPIPPRGRNQQLPPAVDRVLMQALSKQPEQRFPSCGALIDALDAALEAPHEEVELERTQAIDDPTVRLSDLPLPPPQPAAAPAPELAFAAASPQVLAERIRTAKSARSESSRWLKIGAAVLGLIAYVVSGFFTTRKPVSPPPPPPPPPAAAVEPAPPAAPPATVPVPAAPAPAPLTLEVASEPAGARILLEGSDSGSRTPAKLAFEPGREHRLDLKLDGYRDAGWRFNLDQLNETQRKTQRLFFRLTPDVPPATVVLEAPYAVELTIAGRRHPAATRHEVTAAPGQQQVSLVAANVFFRQTKTLDLASGERLELPVPRTVEVNVSANPANCQVSIDGKVVDYTPILDLAIVVGPHRITFDWPALGRQKSLDVTISRDQQRIYANAND